MNPTIELKDFSKFLKRLHSYAMQTFFADVREEYKKFAELWSLADFDGGNEMILVDEKVLQILQTFFPHLSFEFHCEHMKAGKDFVTDGDVSHLSLSSFAKYCRTKTPEPLNPYADYLYYIDHFIMAVVTNFEYELCFSEDMTSSREQHLLYGERSIVLRNLQINIGFNGDFLGDTVVLEVDLWNLYDIEAGHLNESIITKLLSDIDSLKSSVMGLVNRIRDDVNAIALRYVSETVILHESFFSLRGKQTRVCHSYPGPILFTCHVIYLQGNDATNRQMVRLNYDTVFEGGFVTHRDHDGHLIKFHRDFRQNELFKEFFSPAQTLDDVKSFISGKIVEGFAFLSLEVDNEWRRDGYLSRGYFNDVTTAANTISDFSQKLFTLEFIITEEMPHFICYAIPAEQWEAFYDPLM